MSHCYHRSTSVTLLLPVRCLVHNWSLIKWRELPRAPTCFAIHVERISCKTYGVCQWADHWCPRNNFSKQMSCCYRQSMSTTLLSLVVISKWRDNASNSSCAFFLVLFREYSIHNLQLLSMSEQVTPINNATWSRRMSRCCIKACHQISSCQLCCPSGEHF